MTKEVKALRAEGGMTSTEVARLLGIGLTTLRRLEGTVYEAPKRVGGRAILVVLFDERSSLGLVRLRVKKASEEMSRLFDQVARKAASRQGPSILSEITDADIDNLFND